MRTLHIIWDEDTRTDDPSIVDTDRVGVRLLKGRLYVDVIDLYFNKKCGHTLTHCVIHILCKTFMAWYNIGFLITL